VIDHALLVPLLARSPPCWLARSVARARLSLPSEGEIEQDEIEQGVMNHAPTGAARSLMKIHHALSAVRWVSGA